MKIHSIASIAVSFGFLLVGGARAEAAPQALGLVATLTPLPLTCSGGECSVQLTSFCLQESRAMPPTGTPYIAAAPASIVLVVTDQSGVAKRIPAADLIHFASHSAYMTVRASLPEAKMAALNAKAVALEIGADAALIPVPQPQDADRQTPEELAVATGPVRHTAERFFEDSAQPKAGAVRLVNRLINALPETGRRPQDEDGALWSKVLTQAELTAAGPEAARLASDIHEQCRQSRSLGQAYTMRRCLESAHALMVVDLNHELWEALGGS